jgi:hypothetical protein
MRALVVYESMYGNTRAIAQAIANGIGRPDEVTVVPVAQADTSLVAGVDILVVGGPTHVHGMSRPRTRTAAAEAAAKPESQVMLDGDAQGSDLRGWLEGLGHFTGASAAFDTRLHGPAIFTGRASRQIAKRLRRHGFEVIIPPESFFVTKEGHLGSGEEARAFEWGRQLTVGATAAAVAGLAGHTVSAANS